MALGFQWGRNSEKGAKFREGGGTNTERGLKFREGGKVQRGGGDKLREGAKIQRRVGGGGIQRKGVKFREGGPKSSLGGFKPVVFTPWLFYVAVLLGFPPQEIASYDPSATLLSLEIRSGDTIILEELPSDQARDTTPKQVTTGEP